MFLSPRVISTRAELNSLISPIPSAGNSSSVRLRVGQPPPGSSLSSPGKRLEMTGSLEAPSASPRHILLLKRASICESDGDLGDAEGEEAGMKMHAHWFSDGNPDEGGDVLKPGFSGTGLRKIRRFPVSVSDG